MKNTINNINKPEFMSPVTFWGKAYTDNDKEKDWS